MENCGISIEWTCAFYGLLLVLKSGIAFFGAYCKESTNEPRHEISNNVACATSKAANQPAHMRSMTDRFYLSYGIQITLKSFVTSRHIQ